MMMLFSRDFVDAKPFMGIDQAEVELSILLSLRLMSATAAAIRTLRSPRPVTRPSLEPLCDREHLSPETPRRERLQFKAENQRKLDQQNGECPNCGKDKPLDKSRGHHKDRRADGGKTNDAEHRVVCDPAPRSYTWWILGASIFCVPRQPT
jgi:hypothetical protein